MPRPFPPPPILLFVLTAGGCTSYAVRDADREVARILEGLERDQIEARIPRLVHPEPAPPPESAPASRPAGGAESAPATEPAAGPEPARLGVKESIRLAVRQSRGYRDQVETLYLQALSLTGTRRGFSPRLTGVLSYLFSNADASAPSHAGAASLGVSQILPLGGTLTLSADERASLTKEAPELDSAGDPISVHDTSFGDPTYSGSLTARYQQNLLRGFGYEASHDALIQAERSMVYAAREFELFRQDFTVDVARRFYGLVSQQRVVENNRVRAGTAKRNLAQSEALHRVGRLNRVDLYRAQGDALSAENDLLAAEQAFRDSLDQFKIFLGLSTSERLEILPEEPPFVPVSYSLPSAIAAAEANRLDFKTDADQLEDARRAVRIAAQGLHADLTLDVAGALAAPDVAGVGNQRFGDGSLTAGLALGLPLDRKAERNAYRSATIALDRAKRAYDLAHDNLALEVRRSLRELERARTTLDIQRRAIETAGLRVRIATIQFRAGDVSNRDVVEAERELLDAKNQEIEQRVAYEIARLQLRRNLGTLLVDPEGLWVEER
ncbi:MAG TPA: TolC family protein [Planctomycetota bacterium]|jgi:outer membrane protein TolC|nr:TolC family protein [Planctomycetota bacterium]